MHQCRIVVLLTVFFSFCCLAHETPSETPGDAPVSPAVSSTPEWLRNTRGLFASPYFHLIVNDGKLGSLFTTDTLFDR